MTLTSAPDKPRICVKYLYIFADTDLTFFEHVSNLPRLSPVRDCFYVRTVPLFTAVSIFRGNPRTCTSWPLYVVYITEMQCIHFVRDVVSLLIKFSANTAYINKSEGADKGHLP